MKKFNSKIGLELLIPLALLLGYSFYKSIIDFSLLGLLIIISATSFFAYLYLSTNYIINDKTLEVKCGFLIDKFIDIDTIKKIKEITDFFAAPAATIFRLEINYNDCESIVISPKNKLDFIQALLKINPKIELQNKEE